MKLFKKKSKRFFDSESKRKIIEAIQQAELHTSGEIKVHVESKCQDHPLERGDELFEKLKLQETRQRNGVLFYLAIEEKKFAIIADEGINEVVPANFWDNIKSGMEGKFQQGDIVGGLTQGIWETGQALQEHFPYLDDDENEISDEISTGH